MKLSLYLTVDAEGRTQLTAYVVHHSESADDVLWGIRCWHTVFQVVPSVFITDSGPGIIAAYKETQTEDGTFLAWLYLVPHRLCLFHLDQNFYTHVHPLFSTNNVGWQVVHNYFWKLAKVVDLADVPPGNESESMDAHMSIMRSYIKKSGKGQSKNAVLKWFDSVLYANRDKWVATICWRYFSANAHSTARAERQNASVKSLIPPNANLHWSNYKPYNKEVSYSEKLVVRL